MGGWVGGWAGGDMARPPAGRVCPMHRLPAAECCRKVIRFVLSELCPRSGPGVFKACAAGWKRAWRYGACCRERGRVPADWRPGERRPDWLLPGRPWLPVFRLGLNCRGRRLCGRARRRAGPSEDCARSFANARFSLRPCVLLDGRAQWPREARVRTRESNFSRRWEGSIVACNMRHAQHQHVSDVQQPG